MALFHVARYAGPEAAAAEAEAGGRARALLERLQRRARERQQLQEEPGEAAQAAGPAGRRRRRPRRARRRPSGGTPGSKRRKADDEDAGAGGPARRGAARRGDPGPHGADAPPPPRFCPAESSEEAPAASCGAAEAVGPTEAPGGRPPDGACGPPAQSLLLGDFKRTRAPKVSGRWRQRGGEPARLGGCA